MKKIFLLFISVILLSCTQIQAQINFPETKGWKLSKTSVYNSETLWEYINGAADYYLNYGFTKLDVAEYQRSKDEYIKLEIYQHNNSLNTFGIYAYERPSETTFLELGAEGYIEHSSINFFGKQWYVKIHTHQNDKNAISTIKNLAGKVSEMIGKEIGFPKELNLLPLENKIVHSEKYYSSNFLGMSFFSNAVSADYKIKDNKYSVFIITEKSSETAITTLGKYFEFTKTEFEPGENTIYTVNDLFNGQVNIVQTKNSVIGIVDINDESMAKDILTKIIDSMR
jgi:hypothetical protein